MLKAVGLAAVALLCTMQAAMGAAVSFKGTFTNYTTIVGASDPYALGLPEAFTVSFQTAGNAIIGGGIVFTGNSGKQFDFTGGTITTGATTDFTGLTINNYPGAIGGTLSFSFATTIPDTTQASLDQLWFQTGSASFFGFPFTNGAQGFYQGNITAVPEPGSMLALAGLVAGCGGYRWRRARKAKAEAAA